MRLPAEVRTAGVATDSSGNHGQALAYAARAARGAVRGGHARRRRPQFKIDAVRALGAEVVLVPPAERLARLTEIVARARPDR